MKVVIDTNVLISASLSLKSPTNQVVAWCLSNADVYFSESTSLELSSRITRGKFDKYQSLADRQAWAKKVIDSKQVLFCTPQERTTDSPDPDDNQFLEVAVECEADYLITGDKKDLLPLHPYKGIQIVTAKAFLDFIVG